MNIKDVTDKWIEDNFDIDKERKNKTHTRESGKIYSMDPPWDPISWEDLKKAIEKEISDLRERYSIPDKATEKLIRKDDWDPYDTPPDYTAVKWTWEEPETDTDVIRRLKKREREKLRVAKEAKDKAAKKANRDKKEWERLTKKYGKEGPGSSDG